MQRGVLFRMRGVLYSIFMATRRVHNGAIARAKHKNDIFSLITTLGVVGSWRDESVSEPSQNKKERVETESETARLGENSKQELVWIR